MRAHRKLETQENPQAVALRNRVDETMERMTPKAKKQQENQLNTEEEWTQEEQEWKQREQETKKRRAQPKQDLKNTQGAALRSRVDETMARTTDVQTQLAEKQEEKQRKTELWNVLRAGLPKRPKMGGNDED